MRLHSYLKPYYMTLLNKHYEFYFKQTNKEKDPKQKFSHTTHYRQTTI